MNKTVHTGHTEHAGRDVIWNAAGSLTYALASMVLAFAVIRMSGPDEGGIFGFGFSTLGQQMFIAAYFGIRPFHITDMKKEYSFGDYRLARRMTAGLAVLLTVLFLLRMQLLGEYSLHKAGILFLLSGYKILDGYADVYESELQRVGRLDLTGQSLCFRTACSVAALLLVLKVTGSLTAAAAGALCMQLAGTWCFAVRPLAREKSADYRAEPGRAFRLLQNTGLLFLSVFLDFYVFSASKYAVDAHMRNADSGFFNLLFMPASFIYLIANFLIRPMLPGLSDDFRLGRWEEFRKKHRFMLRAVAVFGGIITAGALLLGYPGLRIFELLLGSRYQGVLTHELFSFVLLIAGGGFYALANVEYYILVTLRRQNYIFAGYLATSLLAFFSAGRMTAAAGIRGGAWNYLLLMLGLFLIFLLAAGRALSGKDEKNGNG